MFYFFGLSFLFLVIYVKVKSFDFLHLLVNFSMILYIWNLPWVKQWKIINMQILEKNEFIRA